MIGWGDPDFVEQTGGYGSRFESKTDVSTSGHGGRHVLVTIWKASHLDPPETPVAPSMTGAVGVPETVAEAVPVSDRRPVSPSRGLRRARSTAAAAG
ncbi:hypothetical protein AB0H12_30715 [Actinosynnema sp. NPDC023794]